MKKPIVIFVAVIFLLGVAYVGKVFFSSQGYFQSSKKVVFIYDELTPEELMETLVKDSILSDVSSFQTLIRLKNVKRFKSGRYEVSKGIRTNQLINQFRAGLQTPVLVKVDGVRDVYQLAGSLSKQMKSDSSEFINALLDADLLKEHRLKQEEAISLILPNNYELFWNLPPKKFVQRMIQISEEYWTEENLNQAKKLNLSKSEVYTLASIVKGETVNKDEAPKIAGLYLNRLRIGMPLEADPTITFALNLKKARVYFNDLVVNSPYNTYKIKGLPPGPIFMVEPVYLDAVLNAENHNFIFMCAQPKSTGYHNFSSNFTQHRLYAQQYRDWLNANNIR